MAPSLDISIPNTSLSSASSPKPYTLYNISLRLPLRTFIVQKRYSDFTTLDAALKSQVGASPPAPLPGKSWFKSTATSPELTEERRKGLESYLKAIASSDDTRWRSTSIWRTFLNLPSSTASANSSRAEELRGVGGLGGGAIAAADPTIWLDVHREMKGQLHDARLHLGRRDGATTAQGQHEAGANAKRCLVKAGGLIASLEEGLKAMAEKDKNGGGGWGGGSSIGEGELRRRRDLLGSAKVEKEGLEKLAVSLAVKSQNGNASNGAAVATHQDKSALFGPNVNRPSGRVLGAPIPETDKTRELDNEGVLQLQKQLMQDQDLDVEELAKIVRRQKEMGLAINEELEIQNEMLQQVDVVAERVHGKINIAKKRVGKIK